MQNTMQNLIATDAADKLIAAHDGNMALLYLWMTRRGAFDAVSAARDLCLTLGEVESAYEKLCRMASSGKDRETHLPPAEELPEYTSEDVIMRSKTDSGFKEILSETQRKLGRVLSTADIKTMFGIYEHLSLPADVIFMLLTYCVDAFTEKYGSGRMPSMRFIEKEAYAWANREILTIEQAEEFIKSAAERRSVTGRIKSELGISGRALTVTETKYIDSWLDMGFDVESIAVAYDRTVTNTNALKWNYMNKIMLRWHESGIHSIADIQEKDSGKSVRPQNTHQSTATNDDLGRLRSIYEKVKKG